MSSKAKIIHINLAELTEEELVRLLKTNQAGVDEMLSLMECFFDLFSCAVHFGSVLQDYAERHHPDFNTRFQEMNLKAHNVKGQDLLRALSSHLSVGSAFIH